VLSRRAEADKLRRQFVIERQEAEERRAAAEAERARAEESEREREKGGASGKAAAAAGKSLADDPWAAVTGGVVPAEDEPEGGAEGDDAAGGRADSYDGAAAPGGCAVM
jgi:hypothetical protein